MLCEHADPPRVKKGPVEADDVLAAAGVKDLELDEDLLLHVRHELKGDRLHGHDSVGWRVKHPPDHRAGTLAQDVKLLKIPVRVIHDIRLVALRHFHILVRRLVRILPHGRQRGGLCD